MRMWQNLLPSKADSKYSINSSLFFLYFLISFLGFYFLWSLSLHAGYLFFLISSRTKGSRGTYWHY